MLAIFHIEDSSPFRLYCLEVKDSTIESFEKAIEENGYPNSGFDEVIIVENNEIVCQVQYPEWEE